jgi:hypothetical protein
VTINLVLATSDALVFGCDSVASTTDYFLSAFGLDWEKDADGKMVQDTDGRFTLKFKYDDMQSVVTNARGGVTKMFAIHPGPSPIVAVTSGMAKLNERPIASYAQDFLDSHSHTDSVPAHSKDIVDEFLGFMRKKYDEHYKGSPLPENLREGPEFLIGGYGAVEEFPSIYRMKVRENTLTKEFGHGGSFSSLTGIAWNGQSDAVERFLKGYDTQLRIDIEARIRQELKK